MTSKERVTATLDGKRPDRVPVMHISFSSRIASALLGREAYVGGGMQQWREACALWQGPDAHAAFIEHSIRDAIDISKFCGHDMIRPGYWRDRRKPAARIDEYTFRFEGPGGAYEVKQLDPATELYNVIDASPAPERTFEGLEAEVEAAEKAAAAYQPTEDRFREVLEAQRRMGRTHAIRGHGLESNIPVDDPFWLEAALLRPDLVGRFLDTQVVTSLKIADFLSKYGIRVFFGGGDFASDLGPMYSPQVFHDLVLPRVRQISEHCHKLGGYYMFGTDGNLWPLADDFYGASGIDGHFEVDRKAGMDILKVHERFPHITLFGNISSYTLHVGSVADVVAETRACMEEAKATGKVVAGCSNIIICETPMENVEALLKTVDKYR